MIYYPLIQLNNEKRIYVFKECLFCQTVLVYFWNYKKTNKRSLRSWNGVFDMAKMAQTWNFSKYSMSLSLFLYNILDTPCDLDGLATD